EVRRSCSVPLAHPTQGGQELRQGEFQGAVRGDRKGTPTSLVLTEQGDALSDAGTTRAKGVLWAPFAIPSARSTFAVDPSLTNSFVAHYSQNVRNKTFCCERVRF